MAGAVDGEGGGEVQLFGDLGGGVHPVVPGGAVAGQRHAGLLEEGGVGEAAGQGELGHEAGNGLGAVGAHPVEGIGEVSAPGIGLEVRRQVEPVVGLRLEVGHAGDVGALAGLELDRQLFLDHLVGDVVEDDLDARVVGHEAFQQIFNDGALDAVGVPHHPDVAGVDAARRRQQRGGQDRDFLHRCSSPRKFSSKLGSRPCDRPSGGVQGPAFGGDLPVRANSTTP